MAEKLFELQRRTFDSPHFRGIEFIEVEAKSIINHVPGNYLPFSWTINPYRGCSHACSYCISGETPILMADGRTQPLADLQVGDGIYGTRVEGAYRRYVRTEVVAHWQTVKRAYRVTLEDGTELIASGDHRFLSDRGWAYVAHGAGPHMTAKDTLAGRPASPQQGGATATLTRAHSLGGTIVRCRPEFKVVLIEDLGFEMPMYDITTGTGDFIANGVVSHNCFARATHTYMDMDAGRDFETKIVVKVNAGELLRKELRAKRWKGEGIAMGTATDPYQRAEGRYKLMPPIIEALTDYRNPFSILTKGTLILRDLDLLMDAAAVTDVTTAFSIGTLDEDVWRKSEPGTPHPRKRIEAVARLNDAGIPCGVLMAPILPGISDRPEQLRDVMSAAFDAGATYVSPILLHLRPKVREVYMEWLAGNYPELVERHESMYRKAYAAAADRKALSAVVAEIGEELGGPRKRTRKRKAPRPAGPERARAATAVLKTEQLKLV
ncbi:MAG: radical SAM protein [Actinomycetota bacterium]|nr:radical SAM protein [Actinomycetota bacterium]